MLSISLADDTFLLKDDALGVSLAFSCVATVTRAESGAPLVWSPWRIAPEHDGVFGAVTESEAVSQRVEVELRGEQGAIVRHWLVNDGPTAILLSGLRTVDGVIRAAARPRSPGYLHSLNPRHELPPLCRLGPKTPSLLLGRMTYMFFEGLGISLGEGRPAIATGPVSQNLVHRSQRLTWDGQNEIRLETNQDLRGITAKRVEPSERIDFDGVFVQYLPHFDPLRIYDDYLRAMREATGTRWEKNILRKEQFYAPWNNFLYWEQTEAEVLAAARRIKNDFPTVRWVGIDDGYQKSTVSPTVPRGPEGERQWSWSAEFVWWKNAPGVSFGFSDGLGEDPEKVPHGLLALAAEMRQLGLRPMLWIGMEISTANPVYQRHPEWFQSVRAYKEHAILDVSVPAVRAEIERVYRAYFKPDGWHAVKLDFWSHLFERPDLVYREGNLTAAEWRAWFFELVRGCLPDDGFISLGCDVAAGASWVAPWVDSYRNSNDMRDGFWGNVKNNVRWSLIPALTHGSGEPIADADTISIFKDLTREEELCWVDYMHQIGSVVELGGDPSKWNETQKNYLRNYLDDPSGGNRCWIGDRECWTRDGLPRVVYRRAYGGGYTLTLHNWDDHDCVLRASEWAGPVRECRRFTDNRGAQGGLLADAVFVVPPHTSRKLQVW